MKLENKQELERLVHLVETGLDERLQVTPEVERQKRVIAAMQYSLDAGGKRIRPVAGAGILPALRRKRAAGNGSSLRH